MGTQRGSPLPGSMDLTGYITGNWQAAASDVLAETGIDPAEIAAVSTTCMREGILLYDKDYNELWACANVDARSDDEVIELIQKSPELKKKFIRFPARLTRWALFPASSG